MFGLSTHTSYIYIYVYIYTEIFVICQKPTSGQIWKNIDFSQNVIDNAIVLGMYFLGDQHRGNKDSYSIFYLEIAILNCTNTFLQVKILQLT